MPREYNLGDPCMLSTAPVVMTYMWDRQGNQLKRGWENTPGTPSMTASTVQFINIMHYLATLWIYGTPLQSSSRIVRPPAPTIPNNTSSASNDSNNLVAPLICRSTRFNWKKLSESVPHLKRDAIPIYRRKLFGGEILRPHTSQRSQAPPTPISRRLRSRTNSTPDNNS